MPEVSRVRVSFRLFDETLDPDFVTQHLGVAPTFAYAEGDPLVDRRGQIRKDRQGRVHRRHTGAWLLESSTGESATLEDQLVEVLDRLPSEIPRELAMRGYRADFFCGLFLDHLNEGTALTPHTLGRIAALGAKLSLDVYGASRDETREAE